MGLYDMGETKGGIFRTKKQKGIKKKIMEAAINRRMNGWMMGG